MRRAKIIIVLFDQLRVRSYNGICDRVVSRNSAWIQQKSLDLTAICCCCCYANPTEWINEWIILLSSLVAIRHNNKNRKCLHSKCNVLHWHRFNVTWMRHIHRKIASIYLIFIHAFGHFIDNHQQQTLTHILKWTRKKRPTKKNEPH